MARVTAPCCIVILAWFVGCAQETAPVTTCPPQAPPQAMTAEVAEPLTIATWNVRGYPEKRIEDVTWFHAQLQRWHPDVVCVQEIANLDRVRGFCETDARLKRYAFVDSRDGMDNAIFTTNDVTIVDLPDPDGFQHPAQAALISIRGFDAAVLSVHLTWTDLAQREREKAALRTIVATLLQSDPDVMIVGDFNLTEPDIQQLATDVGLKVLVPAGQDGVGTTHAGNRYDHFLVSDDLMREEAISAHIETFTGADLVTAKRVSDHLPVVATFRTDARFRDRR